MDEKQPSTPEHGIRISEAVILALAPALAYYFTHSYERGYCESFGLPASLIHVELSTVLFVTGALFGLVYTVFLVINVMVSFLKLEGPHMNHPLIIFVINNWMMFVVATMLLFVYKFNKTGWFLFFTVVSFVFWMEFIPALIFRKRAPTLGERLNIFLEQVRQSAKLFGIIGARYGKNIVLLLILTYTINYIAISMGRSEAENKTSYLYSDVNDNLYVSRIYGDKAFLFSIDNASNTPKKDFVILNINQYPRIKFTLKHIGKLNFK